MHRISLILFILFLSVSLVDAADFDPKVARTMDQGRAHLITIDPRLSVCGATAIEIAKAVDALNFPHATDASTNMASSKVRVGRGIEIYEVMIGTRSYSVRMKRKLIGSADLVNDPVVCAVTSITSNK